MVLGTISVLVGSGTLCDVGLFEGDTRIQDYLWIVIEVERQGQVAQRLDSYLFYATSRVDGEKFREHILGMGLGAVWWMTGVLTLYKYCAKD